MVDLSGTNPVSGEQVDATDPSDWKDYAIGGVAIMSAVAIGRWATNTFSEMTNVGDTVSERVLELS